MRRRVSVLRSRFVGFRFAPDVITIAVRWYLRYGLSYRDVEELLAERGVEVDHVTVFRGFSSSHRCSSTRRGPAGTFQVIAGSSPNVRVRSPRVPVARVTNGPSRLIQSSVASHPQVSIFVGQDHDLSPIFRAGAHC